MAAKLARRFATALGAKSEDPPADVPRPQPRMIAGFTGLVLFSFLYYLDERLSSAGAADLRGNFDFGADEGSWLSTAFVMGQVLFLPMTPWLATVFGPRAVGMVTVATCTICDALLTGEPAYHWAVAIRLLQGASEATSVPLMLGMVLQTLPPYRRPEALTAYGLCVTLPVLLCFSVEGLATDLSSWRALFAPGPILGPIAFFLIVAFLPKQPPKWEQFVRADFFGIFTLTACAACLVAACDQGQRLDWFSSGFIQALFMLAGWFGLLFVLNTALRSNALYSFAVFTKTDYVVGVLSIALFAASLLGVAMLFPGEQAVVRYLRPLQDGDTTLWLAIPVLATALMMPALLRLLDARLVLGIGLACIAIGCWLCVWVTPQWAGSDYRGFMMLAATGWMLVIVPNAILTTSVLKPPDLVTGSAMFNLMRTLGFTVGTAVLTAILTVRERVHSNANVVRSLDPARFAAQRAYRHPANLPPTVATLNSIQSSVMAYADAWGWLAITAVCALFLSALFKPATLVRVPKR